MQQPFATHLILQMANAIFFRRQICYSLLLIYNIELRSKLISYNTQITLLKTLQLSKSRRQNFRLQIFKKMVIPSYIILTIQRLKGKQYRAD